MEKTLEKALNQFKDKTILVVGDIMLDQFIWGSVPDRRNPENPVAPLIYAQEENYALGGAANVANNIVSLGAKCSLYGIMGDDSNGHIIKSLCEKNGIDFMPFLGEIPTLLKQRIVAQGIQVARIDYGETELKKIHGKDLEAHTRIMEFFKREAHKYDFVILSDYNKGIFTKNSARNIIDIANKKGLGTLVDPKPENIDLFENCTVICPNKHEAQKITGIEYTNGKEILTQMGQSLQSRLNSKYVYITCGKDGVFGYNKNGNHLMIPTHANEVGDKTGAGDTFASAVVLGYSSGLNFNDAGKLANYAAGIVVEKVGTATVSVKEIYKKLQKRKF